MLEKAFPVLDLIPTGPGNEPDFIFESTEGIVKIEAKTAYGGAEYDPKTGIISKSSSKGSNGAQIKEYQCDAFSKIDSAGTPVLYAINYHCIHNSVSRIAPLQTFRKRKNFIEKNYVSPTLYFVSNSIVCAFFQREKRLSVQAKKYLDKGLTPPKEIPGWYTGLKPNHIEQISDAVRDKRFKKYLKRKGKAEEVLGYYNLNQNDYVSEPLGFAQTTFSFSTKLGVIPMRIGYVVENAHKNILFELLKGRVSFD